MVTNHLARSVKSSIRIRDGLPGLGQVYNNYNIFWGNYYKRLTVYNEALQEIIKKFARVKL
jgi:hypothetical protein